MDSVSARFAGFDYSWWHTCDRKLRAWCKRLSAHSSTRCFAWGDNFQTSLTSNMANPFMASHVLILRPQACDSKQGRSSTHMKLWCLRGSQSLHLCPYNLNAGPQPPFFSIFTNFPSNEPWKTRTGHIIITN